MDYVPAKILTKQSSSVYSPNIDGMSGYALAVSSRQDRVDYSVTKGGWRLWISVIVFFLLLAGFSIIVSPKEEATDLDMEDESSEPSIDAYNNFVDIGRVSEYTNAEDESSMEEEGGGATTASEEEVEEDSSHEADEEDSSRYQSLIGEEERRLMQLAKKAEKKKRAKASAEKITAPTTKPPEEEKKDEHEEVEISEPESTAESAGEGGTEHEEIEETEQFDIRKAGKKKKKLVIEEQEEAATIPIITKETITKKPKRGKDEKLRVEESASEKPPIKIKMTRTKGRTKEEEEQLKQEEAIKKPAESEETATVEEKVDMMKRHQKPKREPVEPSKPEKPAIPVKVHRKKGKSKEEYEADLAKTLAAAAEKEEISDLEIKEEHEKFVTKVVKPVKIHRTRGKSIEEEFEHDDHVQIPSTAFTEKPPIPVKVRRTKGGKEDKTDDKKDTVGKKDLVGIKKDIVGKEEDTCPAGKSCQDESTSSKKELVPVRYTKKKGLDKEEERKKAETTVKTTQKPLIPVKVYKTKGKTLDESESDFVESESDSTEEYIKKSNVKKEMVRKQVESSKTTKKQTKSDHRDKKPEQRTTLKPGGHHHVDYKQHKITNKDDNKIRTRLDSADRLLDDRKLDEALEEYNQILKSYPQSPRGHYGRARTLDLMSEMKQSNRILEESIREYEIILELPNVPEDLYVLAANRLVDRLKFRGWIKKALYVQQNLTDRFPDDMQIMNDFGVTFLIMGRMTDAKKIFETVLSKEPDNGLAMALYGFILKTSENRLNESVDYLRRGIESGENGTIDARFFFHLGDALQRLDRTEEAYDIYEKGVEKGLFLSKLQRSLYNVQGLKANPWWTIEETGYGNYLKMIESDWRTIKDEGLALLNKKNLIFELEDEKLTDKGDWRQFTLFKRGQKVTENCARVPKTCSLLEKFTDAVTCKRGQIKFSVMEGGTRVWPHCGPTNCRLRGHLGLIVPPEPKIRVGNETRSWKRGKFIIFDDSFEHEVWYEGSGYRLVLIVDFWHPQLTAQQRASLAPI